MHIDKAKTGGGDKCLQRERMTRGSGEGMSGWGRVQRDLDRGQAEARRHRKQKGRGSIANGDLQTSGESPSPF